jgi:hypothetical protein
MTSPLRYAAIWDFRFNHIPLPRMHNKTLAGGTARFPYSAASVLNNESGVHPFAGSWKDGAGVQGVPGDAAKF